MKKQVRILYLIGAILAIVGSFLPWWCEGDLIWRCYKGISLYPWVNNWLQDNGGLLIVLLSMAIVGLAFRPPRFVKRSAIWNVVCGATLTLLSAYYVGRWLVLQRKVIPSSDLFELGFPV